MTKTEALEALQSGALVQTWSGAIGQVIKVTVSHVADRPPVDFMINLRDVETGHHMGSWVPNAVSLYPRKREENQS
jgi:hypothetical protein